MKASIPAAVSHDTNLETHNQGSHEEAKPAAPVPEAQKHSHIEPSAEPIDRAHGEAPAEHDSRSAELDDGYEPMRLDVSRNLRPCYRPNRTDRNIDRFSSK